MEPSLSEQCATLDRLTGRLVVSCQAEAGTPLDAPTHIVALARAAVLGGAAGVRIEGIANVRAVRQAIAEPIVGIVKARRPETEVYITATCQEIADLVVAGADIVAFDATERPRPEPAAALCRAAQAAGAIAMADVSTFSEAIAARAFGADLVSTTLAGYTPATASLVGPDFALMALMGSRGIPFVAEGRIATPEEAGRALEFGARFVVVGSAITRPDAIAKRFAEHLTGRAPTRKDQP